MKKIASLKSMVLFTLLSFFFNSCDVDDNDPIVPTIPNERTIVQTAQDTDALSSLVAALSKADEKADTDLIGTLSGAGPFTVFAPNNDAFTALLANLDGFDSLEDFDTDEEKALLGQILTYHVVSGAAVRSTDLTNNQTVGTVQSEELTISLDNGVFVQDATETDARVALADVEASNGIVHVIDKVLVPQAVLDALEAMANLQNIVELAVATDDLSSLVGALQQADAGLVDTLNGDGSFTVFAPTNAAFVALLESLGDDYNSLADFDTDEEKALLAKVLTYHVVGGTKALSTDLSDNQEIATVQGENVVVDLEGGVFIEDATDSNASVIMSDVIASNGVVHIIDKVLLPQEVIDALNPNIVGLAQSVDDLSLLVQALIQADAGLVDVLSGEGPFTVFAPTNAAFAALLDTLGDDFNSLADFDTEAEKELLTKVLTYHVVSGAARESSSLEDQEELTTVQGEVLTATENNGNINIDDKTEIHAIIEIPDQVASNGIVHVVNKVLLPQEVLDMLNN